MQRRPLRDNRVVFIPFTRHFYEYTPPRPLKEIEADIAEIEKDIAGMLREVVR